jgi:UDPglucose 6-dehydrogenase
MGRKIINAMGGEARGKTVALLGLTFKPNTDDMRDAPSIAIVQALEDAGAIVHAYDPEGIEQARPLMADVTFFDSPYRASEGADAVVLVTEWDVLRALDLKRLRAAVAQPILVDLRNIYPPEDARQAGFHWHGIGRAQSTVDP